MFWRFSTFLAVFVCAAAALAGGKVRTWTSTDGRTMQAEFVRELDGDVTFLKDGKLIVIKLEKLSEKDQQVVKDLAAGRGSEEDPFTTPNPSSAATSSQEKPAETPSDKPTGKPGEKSGEKPEKKKPITIQSRTWTDRFGNKSSGKYVRVDGNDVVITRGAKVVTVAFSNLSDADQEYVRNVLISQGKEDDIPSATAPAAGGPVGAAGAAGNFPGNSGFPPAGGGISGPGMMPRGGMPGGAMGGPGRGPGAGMGGMTPPAMGANPGPGALGPMGMGPAGAGFPGGMSPPGAMPGGAGMGGAGGMPAPTMGAGMMPGTMGSGGMGGGMSSPAGMMGQGMGPGMGPGMGGMAPGMGSRMPGLEPTSIPQGPSFPAVQVEEYFECSKCKAKLTKLEASGSTCPRCNTTWGFKQDEFGNKTMTSAGRSQMSSVGAVIVIFVLLGLVVFIALFVGIIVAIVKAASAPARPPQPMPQQRYY